MALMPIGPSVARDIEYTFDGHTLVYTVLDEEVKTVEIVLNNPANIPSEEESKSLVLPELVYDNGVAYTLTEARFTGFSAYEGFKEIIFPKTITYFNAKVPQIPALDKVAYPASTIGQIIIDSWITYPIEDSVFEDGCIWNGDKTKLYYVYTTADKVVLPDQLKTIDSYALGACNRLRRLTLSKYEFFRMERGYENSYQDLVSIFNTFEIPSLEEVVWLDSENELPFESEIPQTVKKIILPPHTLSAMRTKYRETIGPKLVTEFEREGLLYESVSCDTPYLLSCTPLENLVEVSINERFPYDEFSVDYSEGIFEGSPILNKVTWDYINVPSRAFARSSMLESVTFGEHVSSIGEDVITDSPVKNIRILAKTPPAVSEKTFVFGSEASLPLIVVPSESIELYKADSYWGKLPLVPDASTDHAWKFEITADGLSARITGLEGDVFESRTLAFPSSVTFEYDGKEYPVRELGAGIFKGLSNSIESVIISSMITSIEQGAFEGISSVKSICFDEGNLPLYVGEDALGNAWRNLETVILGRNIVPVGDVAVFGSTRTKFKNLVVTDAVTVLPARIFESSRGLSNGPTFGKNLRVIGDNAFSTCRKLTTLTIPESVEIIGAEAFYNCDALEKINFTGSLKRIGSAAFEGAVELIELTVIADTICQTAFKDCTGVRRIDVYSHKIQPTAFYGVSGVEEMKVSSSRICAGAFSNLSKLESLKLESITVEEEAFGDVEALKIARIKTDTICARALTNAVNLDSLTIESLGNMLIKGDAFSGLKAAYVSIEGNGLVEQNALSTTNELNTLFFDVTEVGGAGAPVISSLIFGDNVKTISRQAFSGTVLGGVQFGSGIESIEQDAFSFTSGFTTVEFQSVEDASPKLIVGPGSFSQSDVKFIKLGNMVKEIGESAFAYCMLESPDLGTSVECILRNNFSRVNGVLRIPASVKRFDPRENCPVSSTVREYGIEEYVFEDSDNDLHFVSQFSTQEAKVYIGRSLSNTYLKNCEIEFSNDVELNLSWKGTLAGDMDSLKIGGAVKIFGGTLGKEVSINHIEICEGVRNLATGSLAVPKQEVLQLPSSLSILESNAFVSSDTVDSMLKAVIINDGEDELSIGASSFGSQGEKIEELYLGRNVVYTGSESSAALTGVIAASMPNIEKVIVGETIKELNPFTFRDCSRMSNVIIPEGLEHIGKSAFENCSSLKVLSMSENLKTIDDNAYKGCTGLERIVARSLTPAEPATNNSLVFEKSIERNVPLYVPEEALEDYEDSDVFYNFSDIYSSKGEVADDVVVDSDEMTDKNDGERIDPAFQYRGSIFWLIVKKIYNTVTGHHIPYRLMAKASEDEAYTGQQDFYWFSTNPDVATVDNQGKVTILKDEPVEIWAYALDGSDKKAVFSINDSTSDLNSDGKINAVDVEMIISHVLEPDSSHFRLRTVDQNKDGKANAIDTELLIQQTLQ